MKTLVKNYPSLIVCIFLLVLGSIMSRAFFTVNNLMEIIQQCAENGLLAAGMTLVIMGGGGGVDLSVGSNVALGCMVAAMTQAYAGMPTAASIALAVLVCAGMGAANGLLVTKGRLQPFVATLVTMIAARALALLINDGRAVSTGVPNEFSVLSGFKIGPVFLPAILWIAIILAVHLVITRTKYGRDLVAAGGNEEAAKYTGINVSRVRFMAYVILGAFVGLAGRCCAAV
jgi:ribose transport system permease protein